MFDAVDNISLCRLIGQVEQVNSTGGMHDVDGSVTDLPQTIGAFVETHELRN
jgi:hypothetical protein